MKLIIAICIVGGLGMIASLYAGVTDTLPTILRFGVSHEPFTPSDTVIALKWFRSGEKIYIKTADGRDIWAAWAVPERN